MLRRDFLQAEIQKLAQVLARIIGLKKEGKYLEAENLTKEIILDAFALEVDDLPALSDPEFEKQVLEKDLPAEKLDKLAGILFEAVQPFEDSERTKNMLKKVLLIFSILEHKFHQQSLENLNRQVWINKFLNQKHE